MTSYLSGPQVSRHVSGKLFRDRCGDLTGDRIGRQRLRPSMSLGCRVKAGMTGNPGLATWPNPLRRNTAKPARSRFAKGPLCPGPARPGHTLLTALPGRQQN